MASSHHLTRKTVARWVLIGCASVLVFTLGAVNTQAAESQDLFPAPAYVTVQASNFVKSLPSGATFDSLAGAHFDAISPDGNRLLVSHAGGSEAYLVDAHSGRKLATFQIGPVAQGVAISPNGRWGLAVSAGNGTVSVIDMKKGEMVKTIAVGKKPHNSRFTADSQHAYVTLQGAGAVAVLDMQTLKKVGEFPTPGFPHPHNLVLSPDGKTMWIRGFVGHVAAIDLKTHKVLAVIKVGPSHGGIDIAPDGRYVFTGAIGGHFVDVIDPQAFKVIKRIDVGSGPHGVCASPDSRWVYAAVTGTGDVAVIDTQTLSVAKQVSTGGEVPFWVTVARHNCD